jgi:FkbM family methyltransferase
MYEKYFQDVLNIFSSKGWYEIKDKNNLRSKDPSGLYDVVEIGTSDFDVANGKFDKNKDYILVEPLKFYLDKLPNKENISKVNVAISNFDGETIVYYINEDNIKKYELPDWVKGCNSIGNPHPTILKLIKDKNLSKNIIEETKVRTITFGALVKEFNIKYIGHLKIDTEGHDHIILKDVLRYLIDNTINIKSIEFEYNSLSDKRELDSISNELKDFGFKSKVNGDNLLFEK